MCLKHKKMIVFLFLFYFFTNRLYAESPSSVEITATESVVMVGEPLIIKLIVKFEKPRKDPKVGNIYSSIRQIAGLFAEVKTDDNIWLSKHPEVELSQIDGVDYYPLDLLHPYMYVQDEKGLEYGAYYLVIYSRFKNDLTFNKPGTYKIVAGAREKFSNVLNIKVSPSDSAIVDPCILSDPNEYHLLMGGNIGKEARSKAMLRLENLVGCYKKTLLGRWVAARLGLEYYEEEELEKVKTRREKKEVRKDIFVKTVKYLSIATKLPDDFPLRREVLYRLAEIEAEAEIESGRNNFTKALQYYDELIAKYPQSRYGKSAVNHKKEVLKFQKKKAM